MAPTLTILRADESALPDALATLTLPNDTEVQGLALDGIVRVVLNFPKFTDGRAFSQAHALRRAGFAGDIQAQGDVLIDQLLQMQRSGFSSAVLRADQDAAHGARLLGHFSGFYQGDVQGAPRFAQTAG
jgi:uncharacterized protein (DUF934 family)